MGEYKEFLANKVIEFENRGFDFDGELNPKLFDFQADIVRWALKKGKSACFADCGCGKSPIQLEWAHRVQDHTGGKVLILAPLAVSYQTIKEAVKFGIPAKLAESQADVEFPGIYITNYEKLEKFKPELFDGIVLDESSCLKAWNSKTRQRLMEVFKSTPFKLCCTATPSPNDHMEILNHAAFLNVMHSHEALAIWFINDTMKNGTYRLKHHAVKDFWRWVSSWAISLSNPTDLGYDDQGFTLPPLNVNIHEVSVDISINREPGELFRNPEMSATSYHKEKRISLSSRVEKIRQIIADNPGEIFCVWCDTNYEADEIRKAIPGIVEVRGSDNNKHKEKTAIEFAAGNIQLLLSKPSVFGFGLNFQVCHNVIFAGLSYSYESYYQATRRFWRFGQEHPVNLHVILGKTEKSILDTIMRKENDYRELKSNMQKQMNEFNNLKRERKYTMTYESESAKGDNWELILGDSIEEVKKIKDESIDFTVFSPPFSNVYIYSDSYRDMGNNKNDAEFFKHFEYLIPELFRITVTGRLCAVHCKQLVKYQNRDLRAGLKDFRGDIIRAFEKHGWQYHSEVTIWKDPVIEMQRTKSHGLLYKQLRKDSSYSRQGIPDYLVIFRKWEVGDQDPPKPINHWNEKREKLAQDAGLPDGEALYDSNVKDDILNIWQRYASPVWFDIQQTNVLNMCREMVEDDEKHICPLQLDVIERAVDLWSNPGDLVFSPFAGIGSEGYQSLKMGRRFLGIELKREYFLRAIKFFESLEVEKKQLRLL